MATIIININKRQHGMKYKKLIKFLKQHDHSFSVKRNRNDNDSAIHGEDWPQEPLTLDNDLTVDARSLI